MSDWLCQQSTMKQELERWHEDSCNLLESRADVLQNYDRSIFLKSLHHRRIFHAAFLTVPGASGQSCHGVNNGAKGIFIVLACIRPALKPCQAIPNDGEQGFNRNPIDAHLVHVPFLKVRIPGPLIRVLNAVVVTGTASTWFVHGANTELVVDEGTAVRLNLPEHGLTTPETSPVGASLPVFHPHLPPSPVTASPRLYHEFLPGARGGVDQRETARR